MAKVELQCMKVGRSHPPPPPLSLQAFITVPDPFVVKWSVVAFFCVPASVVEVNMIPRNRPPSCCFTHTFCTDIFCGSAVPFPAAQGPAPGSPTSLPPLLVTGSPSSRGLDASRRRSDPPQQGKWGVGKLYAASPAPGGCGLHSDCWSGE